MLWILFSYSSGKFWKALKHRKHRKAIQSWTTQNLAHILYKWVAIWFLEVQLGVICRDRKGQDFLNLLEEGLNPFLGLFTSSFFLSPPPDKFYNQLNNLSHNSNFPSAWGQWGSKGGPSGFYQHYSQQRMEAVVVSHELRKLKEQLHQLSDSCIPFQQPAIRSFLFKCHLRALQIN